jgi:hypothetical protein
MAGTPKGNLLKRRPTESATLTTATLAAIVTSTFDLGSRAAAIVTLLVGLLAPAYTFVVDHGGLIGIVAELLHGHMFGGPRSPTHTVAR